MQNKEITYTGQDSNKNLEWVKGEIEVKSYPNGDPLVDDNVARSITINNVVLRPHSIAGFVTGIFWIEAMIERGNINPRHCNLWIPFMPGSRQDRLNDKGDSLFTIKSVAKMINSLGFIRFYVCDPHSDVTPALINNCHVLDQLYCLHPEILTNDYQAVVSPDAGAEKKASKIAQKLGVPLVHGWKKRDVSTGALSGFGFEITPESQILGANLLIVDDICDGGGTFIGLANEIKKSNPTAKLDLSVTHGLFTKGTADLLKIFDNIYCTDSIVLDRPGVKVNEINL